MNRAPRRIFLRACGRPCMPAKVVGYQFLFVMTLSLLIGAGTAHARLKYAMAQPLAPGVIGIHWQAIDKALTVRLYRVTESGGTQLGEFDGARKSFVDSGQFKPGEIVRYRLAEISSGKEMSSTPLAASNSSEMIAEGGFEGFPVGEQKPVGFGSS